MVRDEGLPVHGEDVTVHRADPGHRLVVQVEHLGSIKWPKKHKYDCVIIGLKLWEEAPHRTRRQCRHHHHKHRFVVDVIINIITSQDRWRPSSPSLSLLLSPSSQSSSQSSYHLAGQVGNAALLGGEHHVGRVVEERLVQAQEVVQILTRRRFIKELWGC